MYVGNAKEVTTSAGNVGLRLDLDLTALGQYVRGDAAEFVREWTDRDGNKRKSLKLSIWPLKSENVTEYRTHSVKVDTFKPDPSKAKGNLSSAPEGADVVNKVSEAFGGDEPEDCPF